LVDLPAWAKMARFRPMERSISPPKLTPRGYTREGLAICAKRRHTAFKSRKALKSCGKPVCGPVRGVIANLSMLFSQPVLCGARCSLYRAIRLHRRRSGLATLVFDRGRLDPAALHLLNEHHERISLFPGQPGELNVEFLVADGRPTIGATITASGSSKP
jgi:hypothetical protein